MPVLIKNNKIITASSKILTREATPFDLSNLKLYLSATRMLQYADGTAIPSFLDYSGNGYNAVQASGTAQPLFKTSQFGSNAGIKFDGINDAMNITSSGALNIMNNATEFTFQIVMKRTSLSDNSRGFYYSQNTTALYRFLVQLHTSLGVSATVTRKDGGTTLSLSSPCNDLLAHLIQLTCRTSDGLTQLYLDGVLVNSGILSGSGNFANTTSANIDLGYIQFPSATYGTGVIQGLSLNTSYSDTATIQAQYRGYLQRGYL